MAVCSSAHCLLVREVGPGRVPGNDTWHVCLVMQSTSKSVTACKLAKEDEDKQTSATARMKLFIVSVRMVIASPCLASS